MEHEIQREQRGWFKKGVSPNPGGRTKLALNFRALAQEHGEEALNVVLTLMRQSDNEKIKLYAAKEILDRGFGKPSQSIEIKPESEDPMKFIKDRPLTEKEWEEANQIIAKHVTENGEL